MSTITKTSLSATSKTTQLDKINYFESLQVNFFQAIIENLGDGLLILNTSGELFHANAVGLNICNQLNPEKHNKKFIHPVIEQLCQSLITNYISAEQPIILSDEIRVNQSKVFRIRVRLLTFSIAHTPGFLVTIENRCESLKNVAIAEVKKYDLTPREAEIWSLYRRNYSYKDIAAKLYITLNTVKKHMKNIHAKRQACLATQDIY
ncbi:helix-turn-helix transcriptional regulator [Tolypothrix sp. FACHB-123]|uniref:LuxR C-terminal-related transcriptional regulator n=1 Tax=Tolypothrix sp. FACHB-123 TaxID=2692868 RepID=UPI00168274C7|nr:LuxR C-terminal-related transcriptional regulator [Tolypothrix sp. FACHB-123]MBD2356300.1 helix-turn-helix transcriptional regulator [Tolypothrix sp. FACHB-123]